MDYKSIFFILLTCLIGPSGCLNEDQDVEDGDAFDPNSVNSGKGEENTEFRPGGNIKASQSNCAMDFNTRTGGAINRILQKTVNNEDQVVQFPLVCGNKLELLINGDVVWPRFLEDVARAKKHIHINIFGMQGDAFGWKIARALTDRAREGVEVIIVADKSGARMMGTTAGKELFDFYAANGVKVVFYVPSINPVDSRFASLDHRKFFIIDGTIAYNGGLTLEAHMERDFHDMMLRMEGPVVHQLQTTFLLNYRFNQGPLSELNVETSHDLITKYFPDPVVFDKNSYAKVIANIPGLDSKQEGLQVTEGYKYQITNATDFVYAISPLWSGKVIRKMFIDAAEKNVSVHFVVPGAPEIQATILDMIDRIASIQLNGYLDDLANGGVNVHYYWGKHQGKLHAKAILNRITINGYPHDVFNMGSCNLDEFALFRDYEQNIWVEDPIITEIARRKLFESDIKNSDNEPNQQ